MRKSSDPSTRAGPIATPGATAIPRLTSIILRGPGPAISGGGASYEIPLEQVGDGRERLGRVGTARLELEHGAVLGREGQQIKHAFAVHGAVSLANHKIATEF